MTPAFVFRRPARQAAFSLMELLVAVGVLVIGTGIAYPFLAGDMGLYARNFSINKSNNSLRYSLQNIKRDIDMSIEPPTLVTATVTNGTASIAPLTPATPQGAQAMLCYVNYGPAYSLPVSKTDSTGTPLPQPIKPAAPIKINRYYVNSSVDAYAVTSPLPLVGDRVLFMSPGPYTTGMPENVDLTTGKPSTTAVAGKTIVKPGRLITAVTPVSNTQFTITIDQTNPLPTDSSGNCTVLDDNSVYFFRESLYVANTINDAKGNPAEKQLLFYRTLYDSSNPNYSATNPAAAPTRPLVLIRDLDPTPQEIETDGAFAANTIIQPFTYHARSGGNYPITINLPIRALDYARAIGDRNLGSQTADTSSAEFNVYLRSSSLLNIKGRLDDTSLTTITAN